MDLASVDTILLDIEGTTTAIDFVAKTLFGYIRKHLSEFLQSKWGTAELKEDIELLRLQAVEDQKSGMTNVPLIPEDSSGDTNNHNVINLIITNVIWQMDSNRKTKALKQLQGHIWLEGYQKGELVAHVFDDVVPAFKRWTENSKKLYIYSSGSIEAQKLLYKHTSYGSVLDLLSGYFDLTTGPKMESKSYVSISNSIGCDASKVLVLTDIPAEARAALDAGMKAIIVVREGNAPLTDNDKEAFVQIKSFNELQ